MTIKTDNHRREVLDASQLTLDEQKQFDYLDWDALKDGTDSRSFVRFRETVWDLNDTEPGAGSSGMPESLEGWDAYVSETFWSGVVFRWVQDEDSKDEWYVICGRYYFS